MNKVEELAYLITKEAEDRAQMEDFSAVEYRQLIRQIRRWCEKESRNAINKNGAGR